VRRQEEERSAELSWNWGRNGVYRKKPGGGKVRTDMKRKEKMVIRRSQRELGANKLEARKKGRTQQHLGEVPKKDMIQASIKKKKRV